jgi:hypothetical protein
MHKNNSPNQTPKGKPGTKIPGGREPQKISNMQLAQAIPVLQQTIVFLNNANHDYHGHRAAAIHDLGQAIGQLQKALAYERRK